ncbi:hypothetical protein EUTSA_v10018991mg [Eutrema salsugineum]|uniref:Bifunctional inhibitor/plant lipid transfer protein/seed storage helical domain-containing protein n=1 Tax=Eutrema salsugineum TaxID=72664 RepID=V4KCF2_EUTSA|nr:hypothetical protein EUTSA_v10018991mg [Eutrema salsugineum]
MKILALMLIAIIIPLMMISFPASIKAAGRGGGSSSVGGGGVGISGGRFGGSGSSGGSRMGGGYVRGGNMWDEEEEEPETGRYGANPSSPIGRAGPVPTGGYGSSGTKYPKPQKGGGDPGVAIVVIPKPLVKELPKECKEDLRDCITKHISEGGEEPKHRGSCCVKLKNSIPCVCKFLTSKDPKVQKAANGVLRGCHYRKPVCIKMPMPQECRQEVRHCVNTHLYGTAGQPRYRGACCMKFKNSKSCVTKFLVSPDPKLNENANGILRCCHFRKP